MILSGNMIVLWYVLDACQAFVKRHT